MNHSTDRITARLRRQNRAANLRGQLRASPDQQVQQVGALGVASGSAFPGDADVWSIGDPSNPSRNDAMSGSEEAAHYAAATISRDIERVTAVWHGSECVALYFEGRAYRPC